jgi:cytochrome c biogenesis protein CcmG/thiol:disulfide interchange protein DsbE
MKPPIIHLLKAFLLFLGISNGTIAQLSYYVVDERQPIDSTAYEAMKERLLHQLRTSVHPDFRIMYENSWVLRRNRDSIVYLVKLKFDNSRPPSDSLSTKPRSLVVGDTFPAMILRDLSGQPMDLRDLAGKPTLVNGWFIACPPCLEEMPALGQIQSSLGDSVNFVAVTFEKVEAVQAFLPQHPFPFRHVPAARELIDRIGIRTYPVNIFLDRHRVVRRIEHGIPGEWSDKGGLTSGTGEEFTAYLRSLLR